MSVIDNNLCPPSKKRSLHGHDETCFAKRIRMMTDAMRVVEDMQRVQGVREESHELMIKGILTCTKDERYDFFTQFVTDLPLRESVVSELLLHGFDTNVVMDDLEPFMHVFRNAMTTECLVHCAKEVALFVVRQQNFPTVSHDTWVELFAIGVRLFDQHRDAAFESLLEAWVRKSEFLKGVRRYPLFLDDVLKSFMDLKYLHEHDNVVKNVHLTKWIYRMSIRW